MKVVALTVVTLLLLRINAKLTDTSDNDGSAVEDMHNTRVKRDQICDSLHPPVTRPIENEFYKKFNFDPDGIKNPLLRVSLEPGKRKSVYALQAECQRITEKTFEESAMNSLQARTFSNALWMYAVVKSHNVKLAKALGDANIRSSAGSVDITTLALYNNEIGRCLALTSSDKDEAISTGAKIVSDALSNNKFIFSLPLIADKPSKFFIEFRLYTRSNLDRHQEIDRTNPSTLTSSNFNPAVETKFIIHGWNQNGTHEFVIDMKNELLNRSAYNVISVDWEGGANSTLYYGSTPNVYIVGDEMDQFIRFLNQELAYSYNDIHLIGFSLGAQCAGQCGMKNPSIARITGLDPAAPRFEGEPINKRLDATDAQYVDVIHTDGDTFIAIGGYGSWYAVGDVDFYPNGGKDQPGCINVGKRDVSIKGSMGCDHGRAPQYFTESINTACAFNACPCPLGDTCTCSSGQNRMGFHSNKALEGTFYLETNPNSPYCK